MDTDAPASSPISMLSTPAEIAAPAPVPPNKFVAPSSVNTPVLAVKSVPAHVSAPETEYNLFVVEDGAVELGITIAPAEPPPAPAPAVSVISPPSPASTPAPPVMLTAPPSPDVA